MAVVWDTQAETPVIELKGHTLPVEHIAFSPDGTRIVTAGEESTAKVWDVRTGAHLFDLGGPSPMTSVAYGPDGTRIYTGGIDLPGRIWNATTGKALLDLGMPNRLPRTPGMWESFDTACFSPDGRRLLIGFRATDSSKHGVGVWDVQTGALLLELAGLKSWVSDAYFTPDGRQIVAYEHNRGSERNAGSVWDAQTGRELKDEPVPPRLHSPRTSPDGRWLAQPTGNRVEIVPLQPDPGEIAYRRMQTQPNFRRHRQAYDAAHARGDTFVAEFYRKLLPETERNLIEAPAAAERALAEGRTRDALASLTILSVAHPADLPLAAKVAALQAWFGQQHELAETCGRVLDFARDTTDPPTAERAAKIGSLSSTMDPARRGSALALARRAVELGSAHAWLPYYRMALGMAEYRNGHFPQADAALTAARESAKDNPHIAGTSAFYLAMSQFRQGQSDEAKRTGTEAAAKMSPLPRDESNPLADGANHDDLILWLAYREARALIAFEEPKPKPEPKP
jgi:tetratricopeptide (TPR) repeat protein